MDERTERLRDIFMDVTDEETVTEAQAESHGTLAEDPAAVDQRLADTVDRMRERLDFDTALDTDDYVNIVRAFYDGREDDAVAADLDLDPTAVTLARADLHLVSPADLDVDIDAVRDRVADGDDPTAAAADLGSTDPAGAAAVFGAMDRSRRASQRFRSEFEEALTDADISVQLTAGTREDGLAEATEDAEVDVDF